ncbi:MAG: hypothetical protein QOE03_273 [Micromonosporaceae bacterium]|nr:hypothetical protein [Micromonosporaceae bacterium]
MSFVVALLTVGALTTGCVAVGVSAPDASSSTGAGGPADTGLSPASGASSPVWADATGPAGGGPAAAIDPAQARQQLGELAVGAASSMAGYSRARFPLWRDRGGNCDTREVVLKRDGRDVRTDASCHIVAGRWISPYENKTVTDASTIDIDHMVPLANAWRSGAARWTDAKRSDFANDLDHPQLLAVSASTNRSKGDQDPSQWKPPNHAYWCTYAERWVSVKHYWLLTVTGAEKVALVDMLGTC